MSFNFYLGLLLAFVVFYFPKSKVVFDTNTTLNASTVSTQYVKKGGKVKQPASSILGDNPDGLALYGWYTSKSLETRWNFKKDTVESSMTLYAKWEQEFTVKYFVADETFPTNTITVFKGDTVKEHYEYCAGFEYLGFICSKNLIFVVLLSKKGKGKCVFLPFHCCLCLLWRLRWLMHVCQLWM